MSLPGHTLFRSLCIRADAGYQIGTGHVMRCLAIAQAWIDRGGRVVWVMSPGASALLDRLLAERIEVVTLAAGPASPADANETGRLAQTAGADWVVVDGYHFSAAYRGQLQQTGRRILTVDDLATVNLAPSDVVLNYNSYATHELYAGLVGGAELLLGTQYALLRREFRRWRNPQRVFSAHAHRVLLTFGGADPRNVTAQSMRLLAEIDAPRMQIALVIGATNPNLAALRAAVPELQAKHDVELLVNPPNLPELMSRADLVVSAGGSSSWELAFLGVPAALSVIAENQRPLADHLANLGAVERLDLNENGYTQADRDRLSVLLASPQKRERLSTIASQLVDGMGAGRVAEAMATHPLHLRPAVESDARLLWQWANDPGTRSASYNSAAIPWETHSSWYQRRLQSPDKTPFYLGYVDTDEPVGVVRFELEAGLATISVSLAPTARGRGWGARLIRLGAVQALAKLSCNEIQGWVKTTNAASLAAFSRAGFRSHCRGALHGVESVEFRLSRKDIAPVLPEPKPVFL